VKVLGIDPGTVTTGWAVVEITASRMSVLGYGVVITPKNTPLSARLEEIFIEINAIIDEFSPDEAAVELLYFSKNVKTAMDVSHARGVILLALEKNKIPITEFQPNQIKLAITGSGNATKKQIQNAVKIITGLSAIPQPDDAADAIAIAISKIVTTGNLHYTKKI
jgi:crossover junction endodeoxyribonuclease RuvC